MNNVNVYMFFQDLQKQEMEVNQKVKSKDPNAKEETERLQARIKQLIEVYQLAPRRKKGDPLIRDPKLKDLWNKVWIEKMQIFHFYICNNFRNKCF